MDNMNLTEKQRRTGFTSAFSLIEMLVVIGIIGIIAAMVAGLARPAAEQRKRKLVDAQKAKLIHAIENYKLKFGVYPPDNSSLYNASAVSAQVYDQAAQGNALFYELTGVTYDPSDEGKAVMTFTDINANTFKSDALVTGTGHAILNAAPAGSTERKSVCFLNPVPKADAKAVELSLYTSPFAGTGYYGLVIPVELRTDPNTKAPYTLPNYWRYDASSDRRHNMDSYDLWAVFQVGNTIITNGNW